MSFKTKDLRLKGKPGGQLKSGKGTSPRVVTSRHDGALLSSLAAGSSSGLVPPGAARSALPTFLSQPRSAVDEITKSGNEWPVNIVGTIRKRLESSSDPPTYHPPGSDANDSSFRLGRGTPDGDPPATDAPRGDETPATPRSGSPAAPPSFLDTSVLAAGEPVQDAPRLANRLLESVVAELEKSRNLNRDIKEAVLAAVRVLHGMVLHLADSRARHLLEKECARALAEEQCARLHKEHATKLEAITESLQSSLDELRSTTSKAAQGAEAARRAAERVSDRLDERPSVQPEEATSLRLVGQLLEEAQAIREECTNSPMPPARVLIERDASRAPAAGEGAPPLARASYACVARHPLMVKSKNPMHTGDDILQYIKKNVDVIGLGVGVNGVRKCRGGAVAISLESARERKVMEGAIRALGDDYSVSEPHLRDPQLRLVGVVAELSDARLEEALLRQNEALLATVPETERSVQVVRRIKGRNAGLNNVVVRVSPALWRALLERRVRLGYQVVTALDQTPLVQCYRCLGFSHRVSECRASAPRCGYCAGAHDTRACPVRASAPPHCTNCAARQLPDAEHPAYSADCPEWRRWDRIARLAVRYC